MLRILLAFLVLAPLAHAQDRDTPRTEGARALLFQIGPELTFRALGGASLGYKRHVSPERALRLGITVQADTEFIFDDVDANRQNLILSVSALPLRYRQTDSPVALYTGLGPTATVRFDRFDNDSDPQSRLSVGGGAAGVIGVEWDVAEAIGLTAEYGQTLTMEYTDDPSRLAIRFAPMGARLGASVYF